jgi:hypothetical protein
LKQRDRSGASLLRDGPIDVISQANGVRRHVRMGFLRLRYIGYLNDWRFMRRKIMPEDAFVMAVEQIYPVILDPEVDRDVLRKLQPIRVIVSRESSIAFDPAPLPILLPTHWIEALGTPVDGPGERFSATGYVRLGYLRCTLEKQRLSDMISVGQFHSGTLRWINEWIIDLDPFVPFYEFD